MFPINTVSLSKYYTGKRRCRITALQDLDLSVSEGEVFGFLGPNGAGKSTTIKCLMGQISPSAGSATLFGQPAGHASARIRVGYLPENPAFYDHLTALEYMTMVGRLFTMEKSVMEGKSKELLDRFGLIDAAKRPIRGYSKGMVQRLGLAQTLLHDPDLYILDEPMSGLDPVGRALVKEIMLELKERGKTVFFSTHVTADVEAVCDRVAVIVGGELQTIADVSSIMEQGVVGYDILVRPGSLMMTTYDDVHAVDGTHSITVDKYDLDEFLTNLIKNGGSVLHLEPRRKNLEAFFLDIVNAGKD